MSAPVVITGTDDKTEVKVTSRGELVVGRIEYSKPYNVSVEAASTAYEIVRGMANKKFVITDMLIATDKTFGSSTVPELLTIYEASPDDLDTNNTTLVNMEFFKNDRFVAIGLNLITDETQSLVAFAADFAIDVTVAGYYVDT